jgi:hypothetical protein
VITEANDKKCRKYFPLNDLLKTSEFQTSGVQNAAELAIFAPIDQRTERKESGRRLMAA